MQGRAEVQHEHEVTTIEQCAERLAGALRAIVQAYFYDHEPHPLTESQIDARARAAYDAGVALGAYSRLTSKTGS